ncbi:hypothetical protein FRC03_002043 [Tulasnella sp. 419]|nr:hypothetical protein FRC03_002043 [Tulasnella sp. 419]
MVGNEKFNTLIDIEPHKRVTLDPSISTRNKDMPPVGLNFGEVEFKEFMSVHPLKSWFDQSFAEEVFRQTNGHIGAITTCLDIVSADDSFRSLKGSKELYTWERFLTRISPQSFLDSLKSPSVFRRGLPLPIELHDRDLAYVLRETLSQRVVSKHDFPQPAHQNGLVKCFNRGWLHTEQISPDIVDDFAYHFASPLHRWYVEAHLGQISNTKIEENNLLDFVIHIIRRFSSINFTAPRVIGPSCIQRPTEAQFQDEFYRCCNIHTSGVPLYSELGGSTGRVDFFFPSKQWGIELVRDSDRLENHCGRFSSSGTYAGLVKTNDYIILNFCTEYPKASPSEHFLDKLDTRCPDFNLSYHRAS